MWVCQRITGVNNWLWLGKFLIGEKDREAENKENEECETKEKERKRIVLKA